MRALRGLLGFLRELLLGDDWRISAVLAGSLLGTWLLHRAGVPAWWLPALAALLALAGSVLSATRTPPPS